MNYIVIQAGGKGTRMGSLTENKPKALVPVDNLPMIFHLFRKFPEKKFIVIGDYKYNVLENYLREFAEVDYKLICASGKNGTCAGVADAISYIPEQEAFMVIWCDLILPEDYKLPELKNNIIGISKDFPCRWKYENGKFLEERSSEFGVAGHFIFTSKKYLRDVPEEGEFVKWLQSQKIEFEIQNLYKTHEYGVYEEWEKRPKPKCRPFNKIKIEGDRIYKEAIDEQGRVLAEKEVAWYKFVQGNHFENIPEVYEYDPLCIQKIDGNNIYEYKTISRIQKKKILERMVECLRKVHELGKIPADTMSYKIAYLDKTYDRLSRVRYLVPFAGDKVVRVNGRNCRNIFFHQEEVEKLVMSYCPAEFKVIHGDCTFSNFLLNKDEVPMLIDPRGYFGKTDIYGDPAYDWVKLYYSIYSNYDQFNLKKFHLKIGEDSVDLEIESSNWEFLEEEFFEMLSGEITKKQMKLLLALVWLSLTTYAWEDFDSICGAFYNGLYYLEEALQ